MEQQQFTGSVLCLIEKDIENVYGRHSVSKFRRLLQDKTKGETLRVGNGANHQINWLNTALIEVLSQYEGTTEARLWLENTTGVPAYLAMFKENVTPVLHGLKII